MCTGKCKDTHRCAIVTRTHIHEPPETHWLLSKTYTCLEVFLPVRQETNWLFNPCPNFVGWQFSGGKMMSCSWQNEMVSGGQTVRPRCRKYILQQILSLENTLETHCSDTRSTQTDVHTHISVKPWHSCSVLSKRDILWTATKKIFQKKRPNQGQTLTLIYHVIRRIESYRYL